MAQQRFIRTNDPNLAVTQVFKPVVISALTQAMVSGRIDKEHYVKCANEVAHLTSRIREDGNVGLAIVEYLDYRLSNGNEPEWHALTMRDQDAEDQGLK